MSRGKRFAKWTGWFSVAVLVGIYAMSGPYVFPVSWTLGACFKDWTSPSSYLPRASPLMTVDRLSGDASVRICYGAPSARGRELFGDDGLVPYEAYWRTGANEPTRLFTDTALRLGDVAVPPGRYSIYTLPGPEFWEVIINRSTFHWGYDFSDDVVIQEVGRVRIPAGVAPEFTELFTVDWGPGSPGGLLLTWGDVRITIPVEVVG